jgi:hypothetical protein
MRGTIVAMVLAFSFSGCGWTVSDWTAKTHTVLKEDISPMIEREIVAECNRRKAECDAMPVEDNDCEPLQKCLKIAKTYSTSAKAIHNSLALFNALMADLDELKAMGKDD